MDTAMLCPYCGKEMRDGAIPVYQGRVNWCPRSEFGGIDESKKLLLSKTARFGAAYAAALYCEACGVVVVPVPDQEGTKSGAEKAFEKLSEHVNGWLDGIDARQEAREREKAREQKEKERKQRREKDPWEV